MIGALDIGGSSVKYGAAAGEGAPTLIRSFPSLELQTREFSELAERVIQAVTTLAGPEIGATRFGISTTGSVDREGIVVSAGHFQGYASVDWNQFLKERFPSIERVVTANDGRASAWAEYCSVADSASSLVHAVVGTGVGGGIVYERRLLLGDSGQSGYLGHLKVATTSSVECSCGKRGCVESLSAVPALVERWRSKSQDSVTNLESLVTSTQSGSVDARDCWWESGYWLGIGLGNAMNVINPARVTIGGGLALASIDAFANKDNSFLDAIRTGIEFAAHRRVSAAATVSLGTHGNDAGLMGAALLARRETPQVSGGATSEG